jgi:UDP-N-acetylglucosamine:LPS N-acetylglucosamine transferase
MARPYNLLPLLKLTKPWRDSVEESDLTKTFDHYWTKSFEITLIKKLVTTTLPWLRLGRDYYRSIISNVISAKSESSSEKRPIGFFAINCRFVDFFQPLVSEFKSTRCIFFSSDPMLIAEKVKEQGAWLASMPMPKGFSSGLDLSLWHPLFPFYLRLCMFYQQAYLALQQERPRVLLFAEGTSHYDELMARAAKQLKIPTIRIQSGRAGELHSGYRNMCFDVMLCWSNDFVERYQSVSPKPAYYVIGSPLLDEFHQLNERRVTTTKPKRVVIYTQPVSKHISEQDYLLLVKFAEDLLGSDERIDIIVRKHPIDKHSGFDDLQQKYPHRISPMNAPEFSLAATLINTQSAVGFFSTTLSEAAACGVIPVILQLDKSHSVYPFPEKHGAAIVVDSAEAAVDKVLQIQQHPEQFDSVRQKMQIFSQRFLGPNDGQSMQRLVGVINQYIDGKAYE